MRKTVIILLWVLIGGGLLFGVGSFCVMALIGLGIGASESYGNPPEFVFRTDPTPKWTPDGASIVFGHSNGRIYVVSADGSRLYSISATLGRYDVDISPSVSPDGSRIVYATPRHETGFLWNRTRDFEIVTSALDGSDRRRLTENRVRDRYPVWSPHGNQIALTSASEISSPASRVITTMFSDGSDTRQVVFLGGATPGVILSPPAWSPDGARIAFVASGQNGSNYAIYVAGIDGSGLALIRETSRKPYKPSWSPDGMRIAFAELGNVTEVYTADHDGSNLRKLLYLGVPGEIDTDSDRFTHAPYLAWSPDGSEILVQSSIISLGAFSRLILPGPGGAASWSPNGSRVAINAQGSAEVEIPGHVGADYDDIVFSPRAEAGVVLYTVSGDGSDARVLVVQDDDGTLLPANARPLDDEQPATTIYFNESGLPLSVPFDIEQCSNGVVVPNPDENPMLVEDCKTLLRIRDSLGAADLPLNWSTDIPISEWERIGLINGFGTLGGVGDIYLSRRYLTGVISPEFGKLSGLVSLNLAGNLLHGEIPGELGNLENLGTLDLSGNQLMGEIPGELGNIEDLRTLDLSGNQLRGEIPGELGHLTSLRWLYLDNNNLEGEIPGELGHLTSLGWLYLSNNGLEGEIPGELGDLTSLDWLDMSSNELEGEIPGELGNLTQLSVLDVRYNRLTSVPEELARLNVQSLLLHGNPIEGCIPVRLLEGATARHDHRLEPCEN